MRLFPFSLMAAPLARSAAQSGPVYTEAYDRFLSVVRAAYPATALVLGETSVFEDAAGAAGRAKRDLLRRCLDTIAARRQGAGDRRIAAALTDW